MSRISSIFEGFVPPPTPGASFAKCEHRQKPQAKAAEEKPSDELQLQLEQTHDLAVDNGAGGSRDLREHYDTANVNRAGLRNSIGEDSGLGHQDKVKELEDEKSSLEAEEANILSKSAETPEATENVERPTTLHTTPTKPSVAKQKQGRPAKDNSGDVQGPQPRKKRRVESDTTGEDVGKIQVQPEQAATRKSEERDGQGDSKYTEAVYGASGVEKGRASPHKGEPDETKIPAVTVAEETQGGPLRKVADSSDPVPDLNNSKKERPGEIEGQVSSRENQELSMSNVPKRGRGRPRKPVDPNAPLPDPNAPKRGRGRPRKPVDPNAPLPDPNAPKRGRGRPRKPVDPNAPPTHTTPKRGRGRPPKNVDSETAIKESDSDTAKTERGRTQNSEDRGAPDRLAAHEEKANSKERGEPPVAKNLIPGLNEATK